MSFEKHLNVTMIVVFNEIQKCEWYFRFVGFMTIQNNVVGLPKNYSRDILFPFWFSFLCLCPFWTTKSFAFVPSFLQYSAHFRSFRWHSVESFFYFKLLIYPSIRDPATIKNKDKLPTKVLMKAEIKQTKWIVLYLK